MSKRADVMIGAYVAEAELKDGAITFKIEGANISERLFDTFIKSGPDLAFVGYIEEARSNG